MSRLSELVQRFGAMRQMNLSLEQLYELRDGLKLVKTSEVTSFSEAQQFLALLKKFREGVAKVDELHGDNYPQLLNSLLSVGEDGLYSNNLRFIFELIQNVDDADYTDAEDCKLEIYFDFNHDRIVLRYNETGFTPFNVFAITGIAEAAKNVSSGKSQIGEKGIGFKSVFGVARTVLIRSGWFAFELHKENFTIPVANYEKMEYCPGTEMTLFVSTGKARNIYGEMKGQYCRKDALFSKNPLLFLNKLTSLRMYYDCFRTMEFRVSRSNNDLLSRISKEDNVHISVNLHDYENGAEQNVIEEITCVRYSYSAIFDKAACKSRYGLRTEMGKNGGKSMRLQVVFPYPQHLNTIGNGALYSFLPTQLRFNVPMVCHVPFKLDASREFVDPQENNKWFKDACSSLSELLDYAYQDWAKVVKNEIVNYIPGFYASLFAYNNGKERCLGNQNVFKGKHFSDLPIFYTVRGHYADVEKVFIFDNAEKIFDPERVYELLPFSRELFLWPEGKKTADVHMFVEKNIYQRLFVTALKKPEKTADIFRYFDEAKFCPVEADILKLIQQMDETELTGEQVCLLMRHEELGKIFVAYAGKCLKNGKRPEYSVRNINLVSAQEALHQDFRLSETPEKVEKYLKLCNEMCVLADIGKEQFFPCNNALVLSRANPVSSFTAFCCAIDNKDTFSIRMQYRRISDELNRLSDSDEGSPQDYLRKLKNNRLLIKDTMGERQYQNYVDLILKAGTSHMRFIQELLQNADDCEYDENAVPEFTLLQNNGGIVTEYNECGFTRGNVRSITAIGESTKNYLMNQQIARIGEKGIGFKTVFAIAKSVRIHSGKFHFQLNANAPTIPERLENQDEEVHGTRMEIVCKPGQQFAPYSEQQILELCLCLRKLRKIRINNNIISIDDAENTRTVTINRRQYTFRRFTRDFVVSGDALEKRKNGLRCISENQTIVCYIPDKGAKKEYPLYCGLPTKHRIKIPIAIDAPFMLTTSREEIDLDGNLWNDRIREEMYASLLDIMDAGKNEERYRVLRFTRFLPHRQGLQNVYANEISDCEYLNQYDFLREVRRASILPTFDKSVFVSAKNDSAYWFPQAVNYLFSCDCFGAVLPKTALDIPRDEISDSTLNAIMCREAPFSAVIPILKEYAGGFIEIETFREKLYEFLQGVPEEYKQSLRGLPIIPVYSVAGGKTEYISWEDDTLFVKKNCVKSERSYYILNERLLPKAICEKIFDVNINEMNADWERGRYNDELRNIVQGSNTDEIYYYLLKEYARGSFTKYKSREILMGMREIIPLKNQCNRIVDTGLFICDEVAGFFQSKIILSLSVHNECKKFAEYMNYPSLRDIHYQDIPDVDKLTEDDIDDFNTDYFVNSEEILRNFYRDGKISDEQLTEYGLGYIAMQYCPEDGTYEFPESPVRDLWRLRRYIQRRLADPIKIISVKEERTVKKCRNSRGEEFGLDEKNIRNRTLALYTPEGKHGYCFCQMCRKLKVYDFMEVNNILPDSEYFFEETRVALCLECSKRFEAMRLALKNNNNGENPFVMAIKQAPIGNVGYVDIPIKNESIRFTATHLAEIQEILRFMQK